ncbi:hypothetical protein K466DRAFT_216782 [Polyporus arcularius HHB13444]|uniref:Uncharacterized protein n=1 Tax=Polyporus arcularius HHB13444 TaxID=1314778 RepID=A0A5C3P6Z9_9APHY|nr:hypothetical protein K466DRAFT_216782 [Polyporus arcularius HHB13444]
MPGPQTQIVFRGAAAGMWYVRFANSSYPRPVLRKCPRSTSSNEDVMNALEVECCGRDLRSATLFGLPLVELPYLHVRDRVPEHTDKISTTPSSKWRHWGLWRYGGATRTPWAVVTSRRKRNFLSARADPQHEAPKKDVRSSSNVCHRTCTCDADRALHPSTIDIEDSINPGRGCAIRERCRFGVCSR